MKKIILLFLIVILLTSVCILSAGMLKKLNEGEAITDRIKHLPVFSLPALSAESFSSSEITEGPLLIVNFHPECEHCLYEISGLLRSNIIKSDIKLILISYAEREDIKRFLDSCGAAVQDSFITLIDTAMIFGDIFGSYYIPSNYLYDKELNLIEALYGEYKTEAILNRFNVDGQDK